MRTHRYFTKYIENLISHSKVYLDYLRMSLTEIKPQFYEVGKAYEITVNPNDSHQCLKDEFRFRNCIDMWDKMFTNMKNQDMILKMYPEISEQQTLIDGKFPRIHFHGTISFVSRYAIASFLLKYSVILSSKSSIQINEHRPEYWFKYCTKQKDLMEYLCETNTYGYPLGYSSKKTLKIEQQVFFPVDPCDPPVLPSKRETKRGKQKIVSLIDEGSPSSDHDSINNKNKPKKKNL